MSEESEDTLYVVMPAYNEEKTIEQVVVSWAKVLKNGSKMSRIVVADSGSTDGTHEILMGLKKKIKQLEILENTKQFHGPKVIALYKYAIEKGADYIFQTDSDGQTDPKEFAEFWKNRLEYDGVVGYRKKRGDGKARAFVEKVVCWLLGLFFEVKVPDANAPFRLMSVVLVKKYIKRIPQDYALPNIIMTAYFARFNENIVFREVSFESRTKGTNSINMKKIFMIGFESIFSFFAFRKDMKILEAGSVQQYRKNRRNSLMVSACLALISFVIISISSSFFWNSGKTMTDSSVFLTVGRQIKNGEMPYSDTFDHKGPLLYLINFWGIMIEDISGVFIFEFLAVFISLFFMYKIMRLKVSNYWTAAFFAIILFTPFVTFYLSDYGNLVEQYALPFISFSLYVFLKYFSKVGVSNMEILFVGLSFASVLMLRVNMIGVWGVFCLGIVLKNIHDKNYNELGKNVLCFGLGSLIVVAPIIIWLLANGAFGAFVDIYVKFNLEYSGEGVQYVFPAILAFLNNVIVFLSFALAVYYAFKLKFKCGMCVYLLAFIAVLVATCMSGRTYPHYGMVLVPLLAFPFALLIGEIEEIKRFDSVGVVLLVVLLSLVYQDWLLVAGKFSDSVHGRGRDDSASDVVMRICDDIGRITETDDRIAVYGNWNEIYIRCNRLPVSKYSYQFPISEIRPSILDEFYSDVEANRPKVFVIQPGFTDERVLNYLEFGDYVEEWRGEDGTRVYSIKTE